MSNFCLNYFIIVFALGVPFLGILALCAYFDFEALRIEKDQNVKSAILLLISSGVHIWVKIKYN